MKKILIFTALTALSSVFYSQINIEEYSRKVTVDVSELKEIPGLNVTSSCGEVTVKTKDTMMSGGCLGTLVRTYNYSDDCGATAQAEQYIHLVDNDGPVFQNVPKDITIEGTKLPKAPNVTATDNVGDDDVIIEMTEIVDEENNQVTRQWRAVDQCGNSTLAKQVITLTGV